MKRILISATLVCALSLGSLGAHAASSAVSAQDQTWLKAAHQVNLEEIQAGTLAHQNGNSDVVRSTGQSLASDHRSLDAKLKPLAKQLDVTLPDAPNAEQQSALGKLQAKSGTAFDAAYVQGEIDGHKKAITMTNTEIAEGSSSKVKDLAQSALPHLKKHLQMLQQAADKLDLAKAD